MRKRSEASVPVWESGMNPEQLEAIHAGDGYYRLLAAAGSGKTRCLVHRMVRLINDGVDSSRILATTFGKKAADEMSGRARKLGVSAARVGTWHSLCLQILTEGNSQWADWTIDGEGDRPKKAKYFLKDVVGYKGMNWKGVDVNKLQQFIGGCKACLFKPDSPEARALALNYVRSYDVEKACQAFMRYNDALAERKTLTYDDFLVFAVDFLSDETERAKWASRWDYLLTDEVQDNSPSQSRLMEMLSQDHGNLMVIGDIFQAIYAFKKSTPDYLVNFATKFPTTKTIWLGRNYRSGRKIIEAANRVVSFAKIPGAEPLPMVADRDVDGEVSVVPSETFDDEGKNFVAWVQKKMVDDGSRLSDFVALVRTRAQSRALEEALLSAKIPYVVVGGISFYERREVRDLLAYLRVADDRKSHDGDDVKRCMNAPFRFLGQRFIDKVMDRVKGAKNVDWVKVVLDTASSESGMQERQKGSAHEWATLVLGVRDRVQAGAAVKAKMVVEGRLVVSEDGVEATVMRDSRPDQLLSHIARATKYVEWITKEEGEESIEQSGAANVNEMIRVAERFATLGELLDYVDDTIRAAKRQREDRQAGGERVVIMTCHAGKGLEFKNVWVSGMNEELLPHKRGDLEEERRLAYVAMTRAKDSLVLSFVRSMASRAGVRDAYPSRFIADAGVENATSTRVDVDDDDEDFAPEEDFSPKDFLSGSGCS